MSDYDNGGNGIAEAMEKLNKCIRACSENTIQHGLQLLYFFQKSKD